MKPNEETHVTCLSSMRIDVHVMFRVYYFHKIISDKTNELLYTWYVVVLKKNICCFAWLYKICYERYLAAQRLHKNVFRHEFSQHCVCYLLERFVI